MNGPTWAQTAARSVVEKRDVESSGSMFTCPFCRRERPKRLLEKSTGHRCDCGALFYTHQAVAVHFKERD